MKKLYGNEIARLATIGALAATFGLSSCRGIYNGFASDHAVSTLSSALSSKKLDPDCLRSEKSMAVLATNYGTSKAEKMVGEVKSSQKEYEGKEVSNECSAFMFYSTIVKVDQDTATTFQKIDEGYTFMTVLATDGSSLAARQSVYGPRARESVYAVIEACKN